MPDICAIIAEYNPMHAGHRYQISQAREKSGAKYIAAIMSGDFVQRGEPAIFSKFARAAEAIKGGVDIVIELPPQYSLASAERFAFGGVRIADAIGAEFLSFGSESADLQKLLSFAENKEEEKLRENIKKGLPYAAAKAISEGEELPPNDILGVEYLRAIQKIGSAIKPLPIRRIGAGHDAAGGSALSIRESIKKGEAVSLSENFSGMKPVFPEDLEMLLLYRLRTMPVSELANIAEVGEGLEYKIKEAADRAVSYTELLSLIKSKRYPMARIKRILMNALLSITKELREETDAAMPFARVLAVNKEKRELLSHIAGRTRLITNLKNCEDPAAMKMAEASNIYACAAGLPSFLDYTKQILI